MKLIPSLRSSIGFFTIIPVNDRDFQKSGIYLMWIPYTLAGVLSLLAFYLLSYITDTYVSAIISLIIIPLILGFQNIDALADFGDGMMKRGVPEERFRVMKSPDVGSGGIFALFAVYSISIVSLFSINPKYIGQALLFSQLNSVIWMVSIMFRNSTREQGFAYYFREITDKNMFWISNIVPVLIIFVLLFQSLFILILISFLFSLFFRLYAGKIFEKINGDIIGAGGELGRMFSLILINIPVLIYPISPYFLFLHF